MADSIEPRPKDLAPDWDRELSRLEDDRYEELAKRVRKLEARGRFLESASIEKLYVIIFGAYVLFAFVLPAFQGEMKGPK
jgi:hypothetical protein